MKSGVRLKGERKENGEGKRKEKKLHNKKQYPARVQEGADEHEESEECQEEF